MEAPPIPMRVSSLKTEGPLRVSKWLDLPLLVDEEEMRSLLNVLGSVTFAVTDRVVARRESVVDGAAFFDLYCAYVAELRAGKQPSRSDGFHLAATSCNAALYEIPLEEGRCILKCCRPVIRVQPHRLSYSEVDGKFRSMVFGADALSWGIQFSYPQLFQDPRTHRVEKIDTGLNFPDTALFKRLQLWARAHTAPSPFCVGGRQFVSPARLGKRCFSWIAQHPQLVQRGWTIAPRTFAV